VRTQIKNVIDSNKSRPEKDRRAFQTTDQLEADALSIFLPVLVRTIFDASHGRCRDTHLCALCDGRLLITERQYTAAALAGDTARRGAQEELRQALESDLDRRVAERLQPCCATCGRDIVRGASVLLPLCLHSACTGCMHQAAESNPALMCTLCGATSTVDPRSVQRHPLVEAALASPKRYCGECDEKREASHYCADCQLDLCKVHTDAHRLSRNTKTHALDAITADSAADEGICTDHGIPLNVYCTTCRSAVCHLCTTSEAAHPAGSHTHQNLRAYYEQARRRAGVAVERAQTAAQARADRALDASISLLEIDERTTALKAAVASKMGALRALLEQRHAQLVEELDAMAATEKQRITELGEAERVAHTVLMTTAPLAQHLADAQTPDPTVARLELAVSARLAKLVRAVPAVPMPLPDKVTFKLDEAALEQAIRTAGSFTVEQAVRM